MKKNVLYLIIALVILSVFSGASLKTLDYPSDAKVIYNEYSNSALSRETVEYPDYLLNEELFTVQYAELR